MLVVFYVNAQTVNSINTRDAQACGEYLVKNPQDTIVNQFRVTENGMNSIVTRSVYMKHGKLYAQDDTLFISRSSDMDTKSVLPREMENGGKGVSHAKKLASLVLKAADKYGITVRTHHIFGPSLQETDSNEFFPFKKMRMTQRVSPIFKLRPAREVASQEINSVDDLTRWIKSLVERKEKALQAQKQEEEEKTLFCGGYLLIIAAGSLCGALIVKSSRKSR